MVVSVNSGAIKKFRRTPWRFQQTVERPAASDLDRFVSTILAGHGPIQAGTVTIDDIVFGSRHMAALYPADAALIHDASIAADSVEELRALLVAAFEDGPDFICVPSPKPFVFYADHDDWITFFANTKSHLNHVIEPLSSSGYKLVPNWRREF